MWNISITWGDLGRNEGKPRADMCAPKKPRIKPKKNGTKRYQDDSKFYILA